MAPALYLQIKQHILDGIRERHYQAGDRIPTEAALCEQFAVSRMTVNKALRELVAEGWLVRTAGSGSFVADRRTESPLLAIRNIADEIAERGSEYSGRVIRLQRQAADEKVAVQLGLRVGAPIFHSLIVHQADGEPLQLEERFVDAERLPQYGEQDFASQTPNRYLMEVCPSPRWSTWWRRCCRALARPACCRCGSTPPACCCIGVPGPTVIWSPMPVCCRLAPVTS